MGARGRDEQGLALPALPQFPGLASLFPSQSDLQDPGVLFSQQTQSFTCVAFAAGLCPSFIGNSF